MWYNRLGDRNVGKERTKQKSSRDHMHRRFSAAEPFAAQNRESGGF
jgi:hypothetical protein